MRRSRSQRAERAVLVLGRSGHGLSAHLPDEALAVAALARKFDVVVIGGGLAGVIAAKKVAERKKSVALVRAGGGASVHASGAFDVVGDPDPRPRPPGAPPPLRDALKALLALNPHHPYHLIGGGDAATVEQLIAEASKDLFRDLDEEGLLYRGSLVKNLWLPTPGGHVKEAAYAQDAIAAADLAFLGKARAAIVAIGPGAGAEAAARAGGLRRALDQRGFFGLKEMVPCPVEALPAGAGRAPDEVTIARALDDPRACAAWAKELAKALAAKAPRATHAILPPVLGLREPAVVVATLARETGREIGETVAVPPSVPGLRLERALERVLARKGVHVFRGRAGSAEAAGGSLRSVAVEAPGGGAGEPAQTLEAKAFILAAGRFLGGGLRSGNRARESLFDLPIFHRGRAIGELRPSDWFERRVTADHPALRFGVRCDPDLRPIGRSDGPAFENLFAAGSVIDGASFVHDRAGLGVALATGYVAGLNAAEAA